MAKVVFIFIFAVMMIAAINLGNWLRNEKRRNKKGGKTRNARTINIKDMAETTTVYPPATPMSAAFDVAAAINEPITIPPVQDGVKPTLIPLGFAMEAENTEKHPCVLLMSIRSSLGAKHGLALANGIGVIDTDYRGEVKAGIINNSGVPYTVQPGERIAQIMCIPINTPIIRHVTELSETKRGSGGFGSTGK